MEMDGCVGRMVSKRSKKRAKEEYEGGVEVENLEHDIVFLRDAMGGGGDGGGTVGACNARGFIRFASSR